MYDVLMDENAYNKNAYLFSACVWRH